MKKRQEFEEKRKLDSQRKKVENKDKTEDTPKYAKIVQPQSVKTRGSQKQVDVNQEGGDRGYTEIATVKTKSKVSKLSEPITELKNKIKRQNLMDEGGEEKKGNLFSGVNRSPLTNLTKKQKYVIFNLHFNEYIENHQLRFLNLQIRRLLKMQYELYDLLVKPERKKEN